MTLLELEKYVIEAFTMVNVSMLYQLDSKVIYSGLDREQIIAEIDIELKKIIGSGIKELEARPSACKHCFPTGSAFSFHDTSTGEFVIRYVVHQESEKSFVIERCSNRVLKDGEDGLPF